MIRLPLAEAISLPLVEATCTVCLPATFQNVIFQASFVYTMYPQSYYIIFTTIYNHYWLARKHGGDRVPTDMFIGHHVMYLLFLSDFNETLIFSTDFRKVLK